MAQITLTLISQYVSISKGVVSMMTPDRIVISQTGLFTLFYSKEKRKRKKTRFDYEPPKIY